MKQANIYYKDELAGLLVEDEYGYTFTYYADYLANNGKAISLTLPVQPEPFHSDMLFAFFDGLIPEGWLLDIAQVNWKINTRDRMSLLLACCRDCIGAVGVEEIPNIENK